MGKQRADQKGLRIEFGPWLPIIQKINTFGLSKFHHTLLPCLTELYLCNVCSSKNKLSESEFNEFKQRPPKNQFQLSVGLNLENWIQFIFEPRLKFFKLHGPQKTFCTATWIKCLSYRTDLVFTLSTGLRGRIFNFGPKLWEYSTTTVFNLKYILGDKVEKVELQSSKIKFLKENLG